MDSNSSEIVGEFDTMIEDASLESCGNGPSCFALIAVISIGLWVGIASVVAALV
jgi:hypothetical protein